VIVSENLGLADISAGALSRLIDELDELYPDRYPEPGIGHVEIAYRAGQVSVVRQLKNKLSELKGDA
jgi:hypothetical protein